MCSSSVPKLALNIIIVGAGIGGLSAAIACRQAGHKVVILERTRLDNEAAFAVTIPPNASRVLASFGMDSKKARMVHYKPSEEARDLSTREGMNMSHLDIEQVYGAPYFSVHRADLQQELLRLAGGEGDGEPVEIRLSAKAVEFNPAGFVTLQNGQIVRGEVVVAADGVQERRPRNTGTSVIRFMLSTEEISANPRTAHLITTGIVGPDYYTNEKDKK